MSEKRGKFKMVDIDIYDLPNPLEHPEFYTDEVKIHLDNLRHSGRDMYSVDIDLEQEFGFTPSMAYVARLYWMEQWMRAE